MPQGESECKTLPAAGRSFSRARGTVVPTAPLRGAKHLDLTGGRGTVVPPATESGAAP